MLDFFHHRDKQINYAFWELVINHLLLKIQI